MEKSSKLIKLRNIVFISLSGVLVAVALVSTLHHLITITSVLFLISVGLYLLWSKNT